MKRIRIIGFSDVRAHTLVDMERAVVAAQPDLILYAGDDVRRFGTWDRDAEYPGGLQRLARHAHMGLAAVLGNDAQPGDQAIFADLGVRDLHRDPLILDDLAILGLEGALATCRSGAGRWYDEREAREHLERQFALARGRRSILVSHGPPRGVLDVSVADGLACLGSKAVRAALDRPELALVLCGHTHYSGGRRRSVGRCEVVNVASHDSRRSPLRYATIDIDDRGCHVALREVRPTAAATIHGVGVEAAKRLAEQGVHSAADLASLDDERVGELLGAVRGPRVKALAEARACDAPVVLGTGPLPSPMIWLDIEGVHDAPFLACICADGTTLFDVTADDPHDIPQFLQRLDDIMSPLVGSIGTWGASDRAALERAWVSRSLPVPAWVQDTARWIDVSAWVRDAVALPLVDHKLLNVAQYLGADLDIPEYDGAVVAMLWASHTQLRRFPLDVAIITRHCRDDVRSMIFAVRAVEGLLAGETWRQPVHTRRAPPAETRQTSPGIRGSSIRTFAQALVSRTERLVARMPYRST